MDTNKAEFASQTSYVNEYLHFISVESSYGFVLTAVTPRGLRAVFLGDTREELEQDLRREFPLSKPEYNHYGLEGIGVRVVQCIETPRLDFSLPFDIIGTSFQIEVWRTLRSIRVGKTATYSEIAERIGAPGQELSVAQACLTNRLAVAIPCHRAVGDDGDIGVYRWGLERKRALLQAEAGL
jgi:AraC family transcriptional regulator, regulatory protein of adaptative response / methylated-DNA-[protein]-cysteine methyltransferase